MVRLGEYLAAALVETARKQSTEISTDRKELQNLLAMYWEVVADEEDIADAVRILNMCNISYVEDDEFAGTFIVISVDRFDKFISKALSERDKYDQIILDELDKNLGVTIAESHEYPLLEKYNKFRVLRKYAAFGSSWIETAMEQIVRQKKEGNLGVPASDRIVKANDNQQVISEIDSLLGDLKSKIDFDNEVGNALGDLKEIASQEIGALQADIHKPSNRASLLLSKARASLEWLGKKVAETSASEIVKAIIKLFIGWLS